jgi:hypothetical protein
MFDAIKRLFGEGKIRAEAETIDGRKVTLKVPYIGDINTLDVEEFKVEVRRMCFVEHGEHIQNIRITGYY